MFIEAGQSNSAGFGTSAELSDTSLLASYPVPMWHHSNDFQSIALADVAPIGTQSIGEELKLARTLDAAKPTYDKIAILKVAKGGSSLYDHWRPFEGAPFPNPAVYPGKGAWWLNLEAAYASILAALQGRYPGYEIVFSAITWAQGETDAANAQHASYQDRLTAFASSLRTLVGNPDLVFIVHQLHIGWVGLGGATQTTVDGVRAAQAAFVAADTAAALVDDDDFVLYNSGHIRPNDTMTKAGRTLSAYLASGKAWRQGM